MNAVAYTVQVASTGQPWDAGAFVGAVATGAATGAVAAVSIVVEPIDYALTAVQCVTAGCSVADVALTVVPGAIGPIARQVDNVLDIARAAENTSDAVKAVENAQDAIKTAENVSESVDEATDSLKILPVDDSEVIVRGGISDLPEPGTVFSGSRGATLEEAASGVPHNQIRSTTAGQIRAKGGTVEPRPELTRSGVLNERHVNITEGPGPTTFSKPFPNPVPKNQRIR